MDEWCMDVPPLPSPALPPKGANEVPLEGGRFIGEPPPPEEIGEPPLPEEIIATGVYGESKIAELYSDAFPIDQLEPPVEQAD